MASIKIDSQELFQILDQTPPEQNILLVGRHGIGKSQIIRTFHEGKKRRVVALFLGQMADPGDLIGLLQIDKKSDRSEFTPPYWWPPEDEPIVLFLDELNRARPEILQSVMDLALNRTLAGKALPEGSYVLAAVNEGDEYQLTDLDPALVSRFNVYEFSPTVDDWLVWAAEAGLDSRVIRFIQENQIWLDSDGLSADIPGGFERDLEKTPDRRAWERVSTLVNPVKQLADIHLKLLAGVVGSPAALEFIRWGRSEVSISPDEVLLQFTKVKTQLKKLETPDLANLNAQLLLWLNDRKCSAAEKKKVLKNFLAYLKLMKGTSRNEVLAHMASKLGDQRFDKASLFVFGESEILELMTEYVKGIAIE